MKTADFAFIVHSRDRKDLPRRFPWLRFMPKSMFDLLTLYLPPFVVSRITGLVDRDGAAREGVIIGIPMTARQLLEERETGLRRILQAVELAKHKGARYIGLGAMTASLSRGGRDVIEGVPGVVVSTGRTYTVKNILEYAERCVSLFKLDKEKIRIGIVGAAGGIGSGTAIAMARKGFRNFILIDLERKLEQLERHMKELGNHGTGLSIELSHKVSAIGDCDIVIGATSAPEVVIMPADIAPGTIIINDAQPSDVHPDVLATRSDVLVIEGGVLRASGIDCHFNLGLAHRNDIFSCLAETLWLSHARVEDHHSIGDFDAELFRRMEEGGAKLGFRISDFQNDRGYVGAGYLENFAKIVAARHAQN